MRPSSRLPDSANSVNGLESGTVDLRIRAIIAATAGLLSGLATSAVAEEKLIVYAVNYPVAYFAERIAGDAAEIVLPVPQGQEPAFWDPSIAEIGRFQQADMILLNGANYALWTRTTSLPRSRTVDTSRGFADRYIAADAVTHSHGPEGAHAHGDTASVTWLDFTQAILQAEAIADALRRRRPDEADGFAARLAALRSDLKALDDEARAIAADAGDTLFVASHPLYQYFARAYGLRMKSFGWEADAGLTEAQWAEFDAQRAGAPGAVMIWETEPPADFAAALARRGVAGTVFTIADNRGEADFLETMHANLRALSEAVGAS